MQNVNDTDFIEKSPELMFSRNRDLKESKSALTEYIWESFIRRPMSLYSLNSCNQIINQGTFEEESILFSSQECSTSRTIIVPSQENSEIQSMSQESYRSQGSYENQEMQISSQGSCENQEMQISSQESCENQEMHVASQESCDNQAKAIISCQEDGKKIFSNQEQEDCNKIENSWNEGLSTSENTISDGDTLMELQDFLYLQSKSKQNVTKNEFFQRKSYYRWSKKNKILRSQRRDNSMNIDEKEISVREADILKRERIIQRRELIIARREKLVAIREKQLAAREADILKYEKVLKRKKQ